MTIAIYPGTFDPFTLGHVDVIKRAAMLFERVIVAVAASAAKQTLFTLEERLAFGQKIFKNEPTIAVQSFTGLLVDFVKQQQATVILRGIRHGGDFDFEQQLARMNTRLSPGLETLFILPAETYAPISATLVREIAMLGGDVASLVPEVVYKALTNKFK